MKLNIVIITITTFLCLPSNSQAKINLDKETQSKITGIMQQPIQVYDLDYTEGRRILKRIDDWSNKQLAISGAKRKEYTEGEQSGSHLKLESNIPISVAIEKVVGVKPNRPFDVFYFKKNFDRRFIKDLIVPTTRKLSQEEVERLGKDFIEHNGFHHNTKFDKIGKSKIISHMRRRINKKGGLGEKLVISQIAIFKRIFNGLEVFNSKQIVGIHPNSREILSYKSLNWIPVDERSGKKMVYDSPEKIFKQIESFFSTSPYTEKVSDVHLGMYLVNKMIVPAIRLKVKPQLNSGEREPIRKTLIVGLVKGLNVGKETKRPIRQPQEPKVKYDRKELDPLLMTPF